MNPTDPTLASLQTHLSALTRELDELKSRERARTRRLRVGLGLSAFAAVIATGASAANGACPNGLPFCFQADQPALASQVNHNFMQMKEWVEDKVGTVGTGTTVQTGSRTAPPASAGRALFASGNTGNWDAPIVEVRHENFTAGVGIGWSGLASVGTNANIDLNLKGKGTGSVVVNDDLSVTGSILVGGDTITRMRALAGGSASATLPYNTAVWTQTSDADLAPAANTVCFLTADNRNMTATTLDDGSQLGCQVLTEGGRWKVRASGSRGHHQETNISVTCTAQCLTWGP